MDPNAKIIELAETEDVVQYFNRTLNVTIGRNTTYYEDIASLEVENLMDVRRYLRIAPGMFNGSGKYGTYCKPTRCCIFFHSSTCCFREQSCTSSVWS